MGKIKHKILVTFLITSSIFIILTGLFTTLNLIESNKTEISMTKKILFDDYDKMIKNQVETAISMLDIYYNSFAEGKLTEPEAKEAAKNAIKKLRYDNDGYFWIDDTAGILIAHPIQPNQEGKNRIDIEDPNGVKLVKELLSAAKDGKDSGYTDFMWEKPQDAGSDKLSPKRAYSQLFKEWNWVVSTGNYVDNIDLIVNEKRIEHRSKLEKNIIGIAISVFVSIVVIFIVGLILSRKISDPIIKVVKAFEKDDNGQLNMKKIELKSKDEIGLLASTLNEMSSQVKHFIDGVNQQSKNVAIAANTVEGNISLLNEQMQEISSTTEEISAGMEETAASSEQMDATTTEIFESVQSIASESQEAATFVREISERADKIKNNLTDTVKNGELILSDSKVKLNNAIEESKSVTQINELADAILQITSQTNLLALNAAIEASRAGEAGKGFAVVADEIRKLAEDSKSTASSIQTIIKTVTNSVNNLSSNSRDVLNFMESNVKNDFDLMLKASDDYNKDSKRLEVLILNFNATAKNLEISTKNMMKAISEIASATNEGAEGTNNISEKVMLVNEKFNEVSLQAVKSKEYSENLNSLIMKFKI